MIACILTFEQCLEVIVVALASCVVKNLAYVGCHVVPVPPDILFAISELQWL